MNSILVRATVEQYIVRELLLQTWTLSPGQSAIPVRLSRWTIPTFTSNTIAIWFLRIAKWVRSAKASKSAKTQSVLISEKVLSRTQVMSSWSNWIVLSQRVNLGSSQTRNRWCRLKWTAVSSSQIFENKQPLEVPNAVLGVSTSNTDEDRPVFFLLI